MIQTRARKARIPAPASAAAPPARFSTAELPVNWAGADEVVFWGAGVDETATDVTIVVGARVVVGIGATDVCTIV